MTPGSNPIPPTPPAPTPGAPGPAPGAGRVEDAGASVHDSVRAELWSVAGSAKVTGSVEVTRAEIRGSASIGGTLTAHEVVSDGDLEVVGPVRLSGRLSTRGRALLRGGIESGSLDGQGLVAAGGPMTLSGAIGFDGELHATDLRAAIVTLSGGLRTSGAVTVGSMDLGMSRSSEVPRVMAGRLVVRRIPPKLPIPSWVPILGSAPPVLRALRIEATEAVLEGVEAEYVKAERITLGPDCHIAQIEGTVVRKDPSARIGPESRTPPPYGLSR